MLQLRLPRRGAVRCGDSPRCPGWPHCHDKEDAWTPATFFDARATCSTALDADELIKEIRVPKPPAGARQKYAKFTLRKPIDFAVVSVASVVTVKDGVCKDARIVLGAVAPKPLRAEGAEAMMRGRPIDEKCADDAAEAAVAGSVPLGMNDYKRTIARVLVKRAVMGE